MEVLDFEFIQESYYLACGCLLYLGGIVLGCFSAYSLFKGLF